MGETIITPDPMQELVEETERLGLYDDVPRTTPAQARNTIREWGGDIVYRKGEWLNEYERHRVNPDTLSDKVVLRIAEEMRRPKIHVKTLIGGEMFEIPKEWLHE